MSGVVVMERQKTVLGRDGMNEMESYILIRFYFLIT